jgi:benzoate membrane transport protein
MTELYAGTRELSPLKAIAHNIKSFPKDLSVSAVVAGLLIVMISCTGPAALILQTAKIGHLTTAQTASWFATMFIGSGLMGLYLSLRLRIPFIAAWSTPSIALLVSGFTSHSLRDCVGAYFIASVAIAIIGATGAMDKLLRLIPREVIMAMLGGVLFNFGVQMFVALPQNPALIIGMLIAYFVARRLAWRAPMILSLVVGLVIAIVIHKAHLPKGKIGLAHFVWVNPHFSLSAAITLALPLILVTLTSQYATGLAVITNSGYQAPTNMALVVGGLLSFAGAGALSSGVNSAAITAAVGTGEHAHPDKTKRYTAGVVCGISYTIVGILGTTFLTLVTALPEAMLAGLAGLALLPAIVSSVGESMKNVDYREAAGVTLLITVSNIHIIKLGAPFWGIIGGTIAHLIVTFKKSSIK